MVPINGGQRKTTEWTPRDGKRRKGRPNKRSRKGVAHPGYKLHRIGTNGRACGD